MQRKEIRLGTRGSKLALKQASIVYEKLLSLNTKYDFNIQIIKTTGDIILDRQLDKIGGKGLFIKEIEENLLSFKIDIAVHSAKDVPHTIDNAFKIAAVMEREDPRDVLLSKHNCSIKDLPLEATIATGSLRRAFQAKKLRNDLKILPIRGNIDTRIKKIESNNLDGIIIAAAGLHRLNPAHIYNAKYLSTDSFIPAVGQGGLILECRSDDNIVYELLQNLNDPISYMEIYSEREFLKELDGGCSLPVGAFSKIIDNKIHINGFLANESQNMACYSTIIEDINNYRLAGKFLAEDIKRKMFV